MLDDTEPTGGSTAEPTGPQPSGNTEASPDAASGAPATKAARKAPAKRAPRKTAAKKAVPAVAEVPDTPTPAGQPDAGTALLDAIAEVLPTASAATADQPAAPVKKATRARKAPAKKAPAKAAGETAQPGAEPVPPAGEVAGPGEQPPADPEPAPAKKAPRKRVSKAAAAKAAAEQPPAEPVTESTAEVPAPEALPAAPALSAPVVLFQPPAAEPAPRRRRVAKKAAGSPVVQPEPRPADEIPDFTDLEPADLETDLAPEDIDDLDTSATDADHADDESEPDGADEPEAGEGTRRRRRRGRRGRGNRSATAETGESRDPAEDSDEEDDEPEEDHADEVAEAALSASARRRRRRRRSSGADGSDLAPSEDDPPNTVVHVRESRASGRGSAADDDGVRGVKGSTRLEAKRQRRRDNRDTGRRRAPILTEAEFLARREAVDRLMAVRQTGDRTQIAVLEDGILVEHYVTRASAASAVGNVYLGRVQNVLPSMEAAFVDIGRGRNGVLYAGEVNWDSAGLAGKSRSIENALSAGDLVLVQVTKDPIGHKGARLTSQISLPGRFVVYVPGGGMTGISRKLPDVERSRLKAILKKVVPDEAGVIVRTAAEGASEQDLISDVERLKSEWESISAKADRAKSSDGPQLLHGEPDLAIRVVRDIFNDDFGKLVVSGAEMHRTLSDYVRDIAPDLADRISRHTAETDLFRDLRVDEQLAKAMDRKVWLPSGGSLVIDRTEAMTVVDVNTGKYTGSGGNLEQTVTRNNLEAAEEIVRQLRLRDIGGIVVIDFIDMVLESNRDLVLRRLTECLGRDRTKHQVAEVTSLGLVQMTRKRVGEGLLEAFSEPCSVCNGRGLIVHLDGVDKKSNGAGGGSSTAGAEEERPTRSRRSRKAKAEQQAPAQPDPAELAAEAEKRRAAASAVAAIAAATGHHDRPGDQPAEPALNGTEASTAEPSAAEPSAAEPGSVQPAGAEPAAAEAGSTGRSTARTRTPRRRAGSRVAAEAGPAEPASAAPSSPAEPVPAAVQSSPAEPARSSPVEPAASTAPEATAAPARPRRRRAASRPAGPPVPVSAGEG